MRTGHSGNKVSALQHALDAGGTAEPQRSTRCDYGAQQGALDQPHRALTLPSDPALIPRARRDTRAAQRRAVSTSCASLHCTKTVVILCEYAAALKRVQKFTRSRGVGTGAPAMVVKALILSSMSAFLAVPAPFGVLLGLKSTSLWHSTPPCRRGSFCATASRARERRQCPLSCFAKPVVVVEDAESGCASTQARMAELLVL